MSASLLTPTRARSNNLRAASPSRHRAGLAIAQPPQPTLRLSFPANDSLPHLLSWKIEEGYVRTFAWDAEGDTITLGIWGPGEWVTTAFSSSQAIELQCLTPVVVSQFQPSAADIDQLLRRQVQNLEEIFQLNRIRSADQRLLALLTWIGRRFGQVSANGYRLSLKELNLTHQSLAELCGLTRVTVTKALSRYRESGTVRKLSPEDWFIPRPALVQGFA
jgi:CRP-like cAMP-binding protein